MPVHLIVFCFLLVTSLPVFARGPAVEDFVGIEVEQAPDTHGAELLYNLEQDVNLISQVETTPGKTTTSTESKPWTTSAIFALVTLLGLPLLTWSLVMNYFRKKAQVESAANLEILENYRRQKNKTLEEDQRKVG